MLVAAIRRQARLALATAVKRTTGPSLVARVARPAPISLRALSTTLVCRYEGGPASEHAPTRQLFLGNLPFDATDADLREKFEPFGPLKSVRISTKPSGESRGFAHLEFLREEDAVSAYNSFAEEPLFMLDRNVRVDYAPARPTSANPPSHKLYFFDYRGSEESLRETMRDFETSIQRTHFLRNQMTGELTGSGFIEFMSVERATQAIKTHNGSLTSYGPLNLEYAISRERTAAPGGRGGYG
ncbi:hypothetical protein DFH07DRAFT_714326, partial [Mycena maculata]